MELKHSYRTMKAPRDPVDRFNTLSSVFYEAIIFSPLVENSASAGNTLNLLLDAILTMGVFQTQYTEWHNLPNNKRALVNVLDW